MTKQQIDKLDSLKNEIKKLDHDMIDIRMDRSDNEDGMKFTPTYYIFDENIGEQYLNRTKLAETNDIIYKLVLLYNELIESKIQNLHKQIEAL